jgi:hypothetical protein
MKMETKMLRDRFRCAHVLPSLETEGSVFAGAIPVIGIDPEVIKRRTPVWRNRWQRLVHLQLVASVRPCPIATTVTTVTVGRPLDCFVYE